MEMPAENCSQDCSLLDTVIFAIKSSKLVIDACFEVTGHEGSLGS
jgi:hypothetical protein